jgi:hypothetical protein
MSVVSRLREVLSTDGVPQRSEQRKLEAVLRGAFETPPPPAESAATVAAEQASVNVAETGNRQLAFVTPASLATFSGASLVITVIWLLLQNIFKKAYFLKESYIPLIFSVLIGGFLLYMDLTDPERTVKLARRDYVMKTVIALINSFFLAASALGVSTTIYQAPPGTGTQPPGQEQAAPKQQKPPDNKTGAAEIEPQERYSRNPSPELSEA